MGQWSKCYNCKNITDKCRIALCQQDNDDCDNYIERNEVPNMETILEICEELIKHIEECNQREYCDGDDLYILEQGIQGIQSIADRCKMK